MLQDSCEASTLECTFVDLRPTFDEQSSYLMPAGILPTTEGAGAAAALLWSVMQQRCIAQ
jgi:hypothetical protein